MKAFGLSLDGEINVARRSQFKHALIGALYGLMAGTAFALIASIIDGLLYPDLPLGVDYPRLGLYWSAAGLGLALVGFATCWAIETWKGLAIGAATAGILALVGSLIQSQVSMGMKLVVLIFILVPIASFTLPMAWILRLLAERHERARLSKHPRLNMLLLILIATLLGAGGGYSMKMPPRAVTAVRFAHTSFQNSSVDEKSILRKVPGFIDHMTADYKMYQSPSDVSTEGFTVTAKYEDGYEMLCDIVLYPGREPYLSLCTSNAPR